MRRRAGALTAVAVLALAGCGSASRVDTTVASDAGIGSSSASAPAETTTVPSSSAPADGGASPDDIVPEPNVPIGNLGFHDQVSDGLSVVGSAEIDGSGGWVVVRADQLGKPGRVIGSVYRPNERHDDVVTVRLAKRVTSGPVWVSLNVDAGKAKKFEFPGPDRPVQFAGADLAARIVLTVR
jgi:hypothetical protein